MCVHFQDVYVPLTMTGNMVVDGVLASCFAIVDHDLALIGMKPIQWCPDVIELVFGHENGVSTYINVVSDLGRWIWPKGNELN